METLFLILASFGITIIIQSLLFHWRGSKKLPPGPSFFSSYMLLLTNSIPEFQSIIRDLKSKYGLLITLSVGSHPTVFVGSHSLTHKMLVQNSTTFSDRPKLYPFCGISTASYGSTWRVFRRNLASNFLRPSHVSYSWARKWALRVMICQLLEQQEAVGTINMNEHIQLAMSHLSVIMCFGEKIDDRRINDITSLYSGLFSYVGSVFFNIFIVSPWLAKILFRKKWKSFNQLLEDQNQLLVPLIRSRTEAARSENQSVRDKAQTTAYIDTLIKLQLPEEEATNRKGRKLTETEMVSMCGELLVAGTETTSNALQWIMANLVKHRCIQSKLYDEIVAVVGPPPPPPPPGVEAASVIDEASLQKIPYLKAVVLEGLRRHPPGHLVLPHRVTEDVEVQDYRIPKDATINFMVAEMGWDPDVWDNPMEFKPERFLVNDGSAVVFDIAGSKEIKMMPFGAGRRICPGSNLALLHLEYFVANLIWYFEWSVPDGYTVDLTEQVKFTVVMKNPLQTKISART